MICKEIQGATHRRAIGLNFKTFMNEEHEIDIFKAWCKGCGICVAFCPTGVLAKDEAGNPYVKDIEKCINCGWCEIRCPDFAITVESKAKGKKKIEVKVGEKEPKGEEEVSPERIVASRQ